jgi:hypothetical protein
VPPPVPRKRGRSRIVREPHESRLNHRTSAGTTWRHLATGDHFKTLSLSGTAPDYLRFGQMLLMAQLMPNDAALMQRVETLMYQAIID